MSAVTISNGNLAEIVDLDTDQTRKSFCTERVDLADPNVVLQLKRRQLVKTVEKPAPIDALATNEEPVVIVDVGSIPDQKWNSS